MALTVWAISIPLVGQIVSGTRGGVGYQHAPTTDRTPAAALHRSGAGADRRLARPRHRPHRQFEELMVVGFEARSKITKVSKGIGYERWGDRKVRWPVSEELVFSFEFWGLGADSFDRRFQWFKPESTTLVYPNRQPSNSLNA